MNVAAGNELASGENAGDHLGAPLNAIDNNGAPQAGDNNGAPPSTNRQKGARGQGAVMAAIADQAKATRDLSEVVQSVRHDIESIGQRINQENEGTLARYLAEMKKLSQSMRDELAIRELESLENLHIGETGEENPDPSGKPGDDPEADEMEMENPIGKPETENAVSAQPANGQVAVAQAPRAGPRPKVKAPEKPNGCMRCMKGPRQSNPQKAKYFYMMRKAMGEFQNWDGAGPSNFGYFARGGHHRFSDPSYFARGNSRYWRGGRPFYNGNRGRESNRQFDGRPQHHGRRFYNNSNRGRGAGHH